MPWQIVSLTELWGDDWFADNEGDDQNLRANRFREIAIVERRGIRIPFYRRVVDNLVNLICGDFGAHMRGGYIQDFSSQLRAISQTRQSSVL